MGEIMLKLHAMLQTVRYEFYFGVLHPVARTSSRLLDEPSLATALEGVYFIFYIFAPTCFCPTASVV
jgi:hypothetical protein